MLCNVRDLDKGGGREILEYPRNQCDSYTIAPPLCPPTRDGGRPSGQHAIVINSEGPAMQYEFIAVDPVA